MRRPKIKKLFSAAIALLCLTVAAASAQRRDADEKSVAAQADAYLNELVKEDRFSGAVLLARDGKIVLSRGYGFANRETRTPNSARTKIRLGSVTKQFTYAEFLRENVFRPLGMNDTGYDENDAVIENRADGYTPTPKGIRRAPYIDMTVPFAAGGLYSTAEDMYLWAKALTAGRLLSKESLDAMNTPFKDGYGYGVVIGERYGLKNIAHGGGIEGASTLLSRFPNEEAVVSSSSATSTACSPKSTGSVWAGCCSWTR
jgi:CubicO group peptidase (beta-lactamase class C family)